MVDSLSVYQYVQAVPHEELRSDQAKAEEGIQCLGRGGWKSQLLDMTEKKGHVEETWVRVVAAGGSWETSMPLLHHSEI